jgi:uncharacterized membrane protein YbaN (DUF454 family)
MKKILITVVGGLLTLLGLIFVLLPGPSVIFLIPGLMLLSLEYPEAKKWLRMAQKMMKKSAQWLDNQVLKRKYAAK